MPETAVRNTYRKFSANNNQVEEMIKSSFLNVESKELYIEIWNKKQRLFN